MCLVLINIIVPICTTNGFVQGSIGPSAREYSKTVPCLCRNALPMEYCLVPCENSPHFQCLCIIKLVSKSNDLSCFLRTTYGKPQSTSSEKRAAAATAIQRDREYKCIEHTPQCVKQREEREICLDFKVQDRTSSSQQLVTQTKLD